MLDILFGSCGILQETHIVTVIACVLFLFPVADLWPFKEYLKQPYDDSRQMRCAAMLSETKIRLESPRCNNTMMSEIHAV